MAATVKMEVNAEEFVFGKDGSIPVVVQDYESAEVLMLAQMNEEAVKKTFETGYAHYYDAETGKVSKFGGSANTQKVMAAFLNKDGKTLLLKVDQKGYACPERTAFSAFDRQIKGAYNTIGGEMFGRLQRMIENCKKNPEEGSYTNYLLIRGVDKIAKKVGEEAVELVIAAKNEDKEEVVDEAGDFLYHMMVLLSAKGVKLSEVCAELCKRNR
ncbi:MAG: phosphoribosyl-ATP diphosphatase [Clostridia bacterium]|nr:phosphoribosyl-ATP diphosphatase [Clostridia bacterium]